MIYFKFNCTVFYWKQLAYKTMKARLLSIAAVILLLGCASLPKYTILNRQHSIYYTREQTSELNKRVCTLIRKSKERRDFDSIYVYHIAICQLTSQLGGTAKSPSEFIKEDFTDSVFLSISRLGRMKVKALDQGKTFLSTESIVLKKDKSLGGVGWIQFFSAASSGVKTFLPEDLSALVAILEDDDFIGFFQVINLDNKVGNALFAVTRQRNVVVFTYGAGSSTTITKWKLKDFGDKYLGLRLF